MVLLMSKRMSAMKITVTKINAHYASTLNDSRGVYTTVNYQMEQPSKSTRERKGNGQTGLLSAKERNVNVFAGRTAYLLMRTCLSITGTGEKRPQIPTSTTNTAKTTGNRPQRTYVRCVRIPLQRRIFVLIQPSERGARHRARNVDNQPYLRTTWCLLCTVQLLNLLCVGGITK